MRDRGFRDEGPFGGERGQGSGVTISSYGRGGETYGRRDLGRAGGWQPNAEQGWVNQGHAHGGSWDQHQDWEQGASGRGNWGQGYGDQGAMGQGQSRQRFGSQDYGSQGQSGSGRTYSSEDVWLVPGPHSGRGPRGYQRNDQRIEEDICERLTHHGQIDAEDIQVQVKHGEVTLTGTVESRQVKRMAEDLLDTISGIKDVHNQLRVQQGNDGRSRGHEQMGRAEGRESAGRSRNQNQTQRNETAQAGASRS
jgi:osmotically-inducible protein OsmY